MHEPLSPGERAELKRLLEKATPGPWFDATNKIGSRATGRGLAEVDFDHDEDRELCIAAANALPRLLAQLDELEAVIAKLPRTADGVVISDPRVVFWWDGMVLLQGSACLTEYLVFADPNNTDMMFAPNCGVAGCYATESAALAAKETP
jgi:hypothetical protein